MIVMKAVVMTCSYCSTLKFS